MAPGRQRRQPLPGPAQKPQSRQRVTGRSDHSPIDYQFIEEHLTRFMDDYTIARGTLDDFQHNDLLVGSTGMKQLVTHRAVKKVLSRLEDKVVKKA